MCEHYLRDTAGHWCRRVTAEDLQVVPLGRQGTRPGSRSGGDTELDRAHRQAGTDIPAGALHDGMSIPELRWHRRSPTVAGSEPVGMREAIASLESYEPVRTLTSKALALHRADPEVSTATLRTEQARVERSEIVLNRGLRRAALAAAATQDLSMSEIAMRCGKIRCDAKGQGKRRDQLAGPASGARAGRRWWHAHAVDPHRRAGADRAPRSGSQPARGGARMTAGAALSIVEQQAAWPARIASSPGMAMNNARPMIPRRRRSSGKRSPRNATRGLVRRRRCRRRRDPRGRGRRRTGRSARHAADRRWLSRPAGA